jgi:hypothetical protein
MKLIVKAAHSGHEWLLRLVRVPLIAALMQTKTDDTIHNGQGANGIYLPSTDGLSALALQLTIPIGRAKDVYDQKLQGTAMDKKNGNTKSRKFESQGTKC